MKAILANYRQSPRKVRIVADLIRGRKVDEALHSLDFLTKRSSRPVKKLLLQALANAKGQGLEKENLMIKKIFVDSGVVFKRVRPAAMGVAHRIRKQTSRITLVLGERASIRNEKLKIKNNKIRNL
jgi:large subunit ribosomal protein L22